jgi:PAS domain S-box-containing protein
MDKQLRTFRLLIENTLDIITLLNVDGTIRYESPAVERILGYKPEELIGRQVCEFIHPDDRQNLSNVMAQRILIPGAAPLVEFRWRHKDGSWRVLEAFGNNLLDDPDVVGVVVSSRDITAYKQIEQALRQSEEQLCRSEPIQMMGRIAGGVIHDLNNLLTPVISYSQLLLQALPRGSQHHKYAEEIHEAGKQAAEIIQQIRALSAQETVTATVLDLNAVVTDMDKILRRLIGDRIRLIPALDLELGRVRMNRGQIIQILLNLVTNARDAMPEGGTLIIETANIDVKQTKVDKDHMIPPGQYVLLAVSDTGCGMSAETQARMFDLFFTTKTPGQGTGWGLATVYRIVTENGGHIRVEGAPGRGTTLDIYLPRVTENRPAESC